MTVKKADDGDTQNSKPPERPIQYLIFQVAEQACAVPLSLVKEIVLMAELSPITGSSPEYLAGLLNLSGEAIPIFKLHKFLALPDREAGLYSHIILTKIEGKTFGFMSQAVRKIVSVAADQLMPLPTQSSLNGYGIAMLLDGKDFIPTMAFTPFVADYEKNESRTEPHVIGLSLTQEAS